MTNYEFKMHDIDWKALNNPNSLNSKLYFYVRNPPVKEHSSVIGGSGSLNIYTGSNRDTKGCKGYKWIYAKQN